MTVPTGMLCFSVQCAVQPGPMKILSFLKNCGSQRLLSEKHKKAEEHARPVWL